MTLDSFLLALKPSRVLGLANGAAHHPVSVSIIIIIKSSLFISYFRDHTVPPPVYLSLSSTNYLSGLSEIPLSSVGEGSGLVCHTDLAGCCEGTLEIGTILTALLLWRMERCTLAEVR